MLRRFLIHTLLASIAAFMLLLGIVVLLVCCSSALFSIEVLVADLRHTDVITWLLNGRFGVLPVCELLGFMLLMAAAAGFSVAMLVRNRRFRGIAMQKIKLHAMKKTNKNNVLFCSDRFAKR